MRVLNFDKVVYDGYVTLDLVGYILKNKPFRLFKLLKLVPRLFLFLIKRIDDKKLIEDFYILLLQNITISELDVFKVNNISKLDLVGFGIDENDIIITGEPAFLIDLFIDRSFYKVICTEYDLHSHIFMDELCINENKVLQLNNIGVNRIGELFISSFKEKKLMKMADEVFIYRDHEVIDLDTYKPKLRDRLFYNISNASAIIFVIISIISMIISYIVGVSTSNFTDSVASFLISYFLWLIILYPLFVSLVHRKSFTLDYLGRFILGFIPNFLLQFTIVILLGELLGLVAPITLLLANLLGYPLLIFILTFNQFDD